MGLHGFSFGELKIGQMKSRLMTARLTAYHAAHLLDRGMPCDAELMNAKLYNVEPAMDSARNAMEIHAACGLFTDRAVERYLRDAYHIFAPAGTSDVQLLRLGEVALGLSKGQWSKRLSRHLQTPPGDTPSRAARCQEVYAPVTRIVESRSAAAVLPDKRREGARNRR
jgi:hypothetical protein